jgi:GMP synthase PP-ATPase subunit
MSGTTITALATKLTYLYVDLTQCERQVKDLKHIVYLNAKLMKKMWNVFVSTGLCQLGFCDRVSAEQTHHGLFHIERLFQHSKNRKQFLEAWKGVTHEPRVHHYHATSLLEYSRFVDKYED